MKIAILAVDDIIDGKRRVAGEVVTVPDGYANVRRILRDLSTVADRNRDDFFVIGLRKLQAILQADFPAEWAALQKRPAVQEKIIAELREQPKFLRRALDDPQWFIDTVRKRLQGAANAGK